MWTAVAYRQTHSPSWLAWFDDQSAFIKRTRQPLQCLWNDDSTINTNNGNIIFGLKLKWYIKCRKILAFDGGKLNRIRLLIQTFLSDG